MAAEDYHDMSLLGDFNYQIQAGGDWLTVTERALKEHRMVNRGASRTQQKQTTNDKVKRNRFYVGSDNALDRNWGHPTLPKAIKHAEEILDEQGREQTFIVQIVRVVRRRKAPVEVEKV